MMYKTMMMTAALMISAPVFAGSFQPPEGCETFLTVQSKGCNVSNYYICAADPKGDKWVMAYDQDGPYQIQHHDNEFQWLEDISIGDKTRQTLDPNPKDPASLTGLLRGEDHYDFGLSKDNGEKSHVAGYDRLTGKTVTIDGVDLLETEFSIIGTDENGQILYKGRGNQYLHPEWRLFFSGHEEWAENGQWFPIDGSPVKLIEPGEPGFAGTQPVYECGAVMSSYHPSAQGE